MIEKYVYMDDDGDEDFQVLLNSSIANDKSLVTKLLETLSIETFSYVFA